MELRVYGDPRTASTVRLVNISRLGAAIFAEYLLGEPGMRLVLEMWDQVGSGRVTLPCHVLWALGEKDPPPNQDPRWLHGAAFVDIDTRALRLVGNLIRSAGGAW